MENMGPFSPAQVLEACGRQHDPQVESRPSRGYDSWGGTDLIVFMSHSYQSAPESSKLVSKPKPSLRGFAEALRPKEEQLARLSFSVNERPMTTNVQNSIQGRGFRSN